MSFANKKNRHQELRTSVFLCIYCNPSFKRTKHIRKTKLTKTLQNEQHKPYNLTPAKSLFQM